MESYYSRKKTGGSNASAGFLFQDYCALILLFKNMNDPDFQAISLETINDITLIYKNREILVQVKKQKINRGKFLKILKDIELQSEKQFLVIGSSVAEDLKYLFRDKRVLLNIKMSDKSVKDVEQAVADFKQVLTKKDMNDFYEKIIETELIEYPEDHIELFLLNYYNEWVKENDFTIKEEFLDNLKVYVQRLRSHRGFLSKSKVMEELNNYKIESDIRKIVNIIYEEKLNITSNVLKLLGEDKEEVLFNLEELIKKAEELINKEEYEEALKIYETLSRTFNKTPLLEKCASLNEFLGENNEVIKFCDRILDVDKNNFYGYLMKGTAHGNLGELDSALNCFFSAREIKEVPELFFSIGYIYRQKSVITKALEYYTLCLNLDDTFYEAHLNISEMCTTPEAIRHLDRAIELKPDLYQAYGRKGEVLRYIGLHDLAVRYFEKCLSFDKTNYQSLLGLTLCLIELGRIEESFVYLGSYLKEYQAIKEGIEIGNSDVIIDVGWNSTRVITLTRIGIESYLVDIGGFKLIINTNTDGMIYVSVVMDSLIMKPKLVFGKKYNNSSAYKNDVLEIQKFTDDSTIRVLLEEQYDKFCINMEFGGFSIVGYTDTKSISVDEYERIFNVLNYVDIVLSNLNDIENFSMKKISNVQFRKEISRESYEVTEDIINDAIRKAHEE